MNNESIIETLGENTLHKLADVAILEACSSTGVGSSAPSRTFEFYQETFRLSDNLGDSVTVKVDHEPELQRVIDERVSGFWETYESLMFAEKQNHLSTAISILDAILSNKVYTALWNHFIVSAEPGQPLPYNDWLSEEQKLKHKEYFIKHQERFQ